MVMDLNDRLLNRVCVAMTMLRTNGLQKAIIVSDFGRKISCFVHQEIRKRVKQTKTV